MAIISQLILKSVNLLFIFFIFLFDNLVSDPIQSVQWHVRGPGLGILHFLLSRNFMYVGDGANFSRGGSVTCSNTSQFPIALFIRQLSFTMYTFLPWY